MLAGGSRFAAPARTAAEPGGVEQDDLAARRIRCVRPHRPPEPDALDRPSGARAHALRTLEERGNLRWGDGGSLDASSIPGAHGR